MFVVAEDERFESGRGEVGGEAFLFETCPAKGDGGVDVDEYEEGATGEDFEDGFIVD